VFDTKKLLKPIPSLGSVPQLTADLLIHSLDLRRVGRLSSRDHIPIVGGLDGVQQVQKSENGTTTASSSAQAGIETAVEGDYLGLCEMCIY
jgi:proteasome assembly chaperone (PAC2) family protein